MSRRPSARSASAARGQLHGLARRLLASGLGGGGLLPDRGDLALGVGLRDLDGLLQLRELRGDALSGLAAGGLHGLLQLGDPCGLRVTGLLGLAGARFEPSQLLRPGSGLALRGLDRGGELLGAGGGLVAGSLGSRRAGLQLGQLRRRLGLGARALQRRRQRLGPGDLRVAGGLQLLHARLELRAAAAGLRGLGGLREGGLVHGRVDPLLELQLELEEGLLEDRDAALGGLGIERRVAAGRGERGLQRLDLLLELLDLVAERASAAPPASAVWAAAASAAAARASASSARRSISRMRPRMSSGSTSRADSARVSASRFSSSSKRSCAARASSATRPSSESRSSTCVSRLCSITRRSLSTRRKRLDLVRVVALARDGDHALHLVRAVALALDGLARLLQRRLRLAQLGLELADAGDGLGVEGAEVEAGLMGGEGALAGGQELLALRHHLLGLLHQLLRLLADALLDLLLGRGGVAGVDGAAQAARWRTALGQLLQPRLDLPLAHYLAYRQREVAS